MPSDLLVRDGRVSSGDDRTAGGDPAPFCIRGTRRRLIEAVKAEEDRRVLMTELERELPNNFARHLGTTRSTVELRQRALRTDLPLAIFTEFEKSRSDRFLKLQGPDRIEGLIGQPLKLGPVPHRDEHRVGQFVQRRPICIGIDRKPYPNREIPGSRLERDVVLFELHNTD